MTASARLQVGSLFLCYGTAGLFWGVLAASTPALQANAALTEAGFGLALGVMALTALPVMRLLGPRLHRIESRAIPAAFAVFAAGALLMGVAHSLTTLIPALMIAGGASGAMDIALNNRTARIEAETGARLFNRTHALFPAAMLGASAITGALRSVGVPLWILFATVCLAFALAAAVEMRAGGHVRPGPATNGKTVRARLSGAVIVLAAIAAAGAFQEASSLGWAAIFVERVREGGAFLAGLAPAAFTLGLSAGRLAAHAVEHRTGTAATVRAAALLAAPCFLALALGAPLWAAIPCFFLAGMGVGPIEPAVFRSVARSAEGADRGRMLASVTGVAYLGYLVSPPALGLVAETFGFAALWGGVATLALVVALLSRRLSGIY